MFSKKVHKADIWVHSASFFLFFFPPLWSRMDISFSSFSQYVWIIPVVSLCVSPPVILSFCLRVTVSPSCSSCWNTPLCTSSGDVCACLSQIWLLSTDLTKSLHTREEDSNDEKQQRRGKQKTRVQCDMKLNKIRCFMWVCSLMEQRHCAKTRIKDTCAFLVSS